MPLGIDAELYGRAFGQLDGPVHWPSLTADERAARSEELADWVTELVARFDVEPRVIPACWQRHNGIVEALSALRDHERASYADTASPTAAVDWLRALRGSSCGCTSWGRRPSAPPRPTETPSPARGRPRGAVRPQALRQGRIDGWAPDWIEQPV